MPRLIIVTLMSVIAMIFSVQMLAVNRPAADDSAGSGAIEGTRAGQTVQRNYYAGDRTVLRRENGQFYLTGMVNGQDARFLVDTGADMVALTTDDAEMLGIDVNPANFRPITQTASGIGYGEVVTIDHLDVAGRELKNVRAIVVDGLGVNLLGQSVLRKLGKIELQGEELVITP